MEFSPLNVRKALSSRVSPPNLLFDASVSPSLTSPQGCLSLFAKTITEVACSCFQGAFERNAPLLVALVVQRSPGSTCQHRECWYPHEFYGFWQFS